MMPKTTHYTNLSTLVNKEKEAKRKYNNIPNKQKNK